MNWKVYVLWETISEIRLGRSNIRAVIREKQSGPETFFKMLLLVPVILIFSPIILVVCLFYVASRVGLHLLFLLLWLPHGKDTILIYSQSPVWHDYMATKILPLVKDRAVVLDWSERKRWKKKFSFPVLAFRLLGGNRNFNPLVIHFRAFKPTRIFRFWWSCKAWKHGHVEAVEQLRGELTRVLGE